MRIPSSCLPIPLLFAGLTLGCVNTTGLADGCIGDCRGRIGASADGAPGDGAPEADAASSDADADSPSCPSGRGPAMVEIKESFAHFCIDETEVTNAQYKAFLDTSPSTASLPNLCSWDAPLGPKADWPVRVDQVDLPVANVNWCDAWAFCAWAGKRLCGAIGSTASLDDTQATNPLKSQWYLACGGSSLDAYPYGNTFDDKKCNGATYLTPSPTSLIAVKSAASCVGHYPGVFDMSGNVFEWIDSCATGTGTSQTDNCRKMGGGYNSPQNEMACDFRALEPRDRVVADLGFRCCADFP